MNHSCDIKIYKPSGDSMRPFLRGNDVLIVKKVPTHCLSIGDLIVFNNKQNLPYYIVHRLIRKIKMEDGKTFFQAKGDANGFFDSPVSYEEIIGKVYFVEKDYKCGAKKLLNLDSWGRKKINYFLAKTGYFKIMIYYGYKYFRHKLRALI